MGVMEDFERIMRAQAEAKRRIAESARRVAREQEELARRTAEEMQQNRTTQADRLAATATQGRAAGAFVRGIVHPPPPAWAESPGIPVHQMMPSSSSSGASSTADIRKEGGGGEEKKKARVDHSAFNCPISYLTMEDPVILPDGHTYDRKSIVGWLQEKMTSPLSGQRMPKDVPLIPNRLVMSLIRDDFNPEAIQEEVVTLRAEIGRLTGENELLQHRILKLVLEAFRPNLEAWNESMDAIPIRAWDGILSYLPLREIWGMRLICKRWNEVWHGKFFPEFKRRFYSRLGKILHFPKDPETILWPGSTFTGGFVASTLMDDPIPGQKGEGIGSEWDSQDVDIFTTSPISRVPHIPGPYVTESSRWSYYEYGTDGSHKAQERTRKLAYYYERDEDGKRTKLLEIILWKSIDPEHLLASMDFSACACSFDGKTLYIQRPGDTMNRIIHVNSKSHDSFRDVRVVKYSRRGWKIYGLEKV